MIDTKVRLRCAAWAALPGEDILRCYAFLRETGEKGVTDNFLLVGTLIDTDGDRRTSVLYRVTVWTDHNRNEADRKMMQMVMVNSFIEWILDFTGSRSV